MIDFALAGWMIAGGFTGATLWGLVWLLFHKREPKPNVRMTREEMEGYKMIKRYEDDVKKQPVRPRFDTWV